MAKRKIIGHASQASALATELRLVFGQLKRRLMAQSDVDDFTNSQLAVLLHLEKHGPSSVTALARIEGIRSQSMGTTVSTLETAGMVVGSTDPEDGRRTIFELTPACREFIETKRAARQDWLVHEIQSKLLPEEQEQLTSAIELLKRIAGP